ncbi:chemotaxis protein CheB [Flavobacterium sp.]|uniref:chemotaxis protein CheB n=1 Tax=Flavobacterium sp. TaxID=239 RepID=UPI003C4406A6
MEENSKIANCKLVIIGGSAGSLQSILKIIPFINKTISYSIVIVVHRKNTEDTILEDLISVKSSLPLYYVEDKLPIQTGCIYVAPSGYHMLFEKNHTIALDASEKVFYSRPSIDVSFESAAQIFNNELIGILLSGANADGTLGLKTIQKRKGISIIQNPKTAEIPYMPEFAILNSEPDYILTEEEIVLFLNSLPKKKGE